ncbi:hypothetical protein WN943_010907 [Citrus x changshan-huyou]
MSLKTSKNRLRECKALKKNIIDVDPKSKYISLTLANFEQNPVEMTPLAGNGELKTVALTLTAPEGAALHCTNDSRHSRNRAKPSQQMPNEKR